MKLNKDRPDNSISKLNTFRFFAIFLICSFIFVPHSVASDVSNIVPSAECEKYFSKYFTDEKFLKKVEVDKILYHASRRATSWNTPSYYVYSKLVNFVRKKLQSFLQRRNGAPIPTILYIGNIEKELKPIRDLAENYANPEILDDSAGDTIKNLIAEYETYYYQTNKIFDTATVELSNLRILKNALSIINKNKKHIDHSKGYIIPELYLSSEDVMDDAGKQGLDRLTGAKVVRTKVKIRPRYINDMNSLSVYDINKSKDRVVELIGGKFIPGNIWLKNPVGWNKTILSGGKIEKIGIRQAWLHAQLKVVRSKLRKWKTREGENYDSERTELLNKIEKLLTDPELAPEERFQYEVVGEELKEELRVLISNISKMEERFIKLADDNPEYVEIYENIEAKMLTPGFNNPVSYAFTFIRDKMYLKKLLESEGIKTFIAKYDKFIPGMSVIVLGTGLTSAKIAAAIISTGVGLFSMGASERQRCAEAPDDKAFDECMDKIIKDRVDTAIDVEVFVTEMKKFVKSRGEESQVNIKDKKVKELYDDLTDLLERRADVELLRDKAETIKNTATRVKEELREDLKQRLKEKHESYKTIDEKSGDIKWKEEKEEYGIFHKFKGKPYRKITEQIQQDKKDTGDKETENSAEDKKNSEDEKKNKEDNNGKKEPEEKNNLSDRNSRRRKI